MSKTKELGANHYEILFIIPNNYTEDEAKKISQSTEELIKKIGGKINYQEYWGKKKLAYEIKGFHHGYYNLFEFDLEGNKLAALDRKLKLSSDVLRHQIIRRKKRSHEEIEKEKARQEKSIKKEKEDKKTEETIKKEIKKPKEETNTKVKEKNDAKNNLKDLDEKLEGILDSSDLI
jgi:small subunit ribosomal protein S6